MKFRFFFLITFFSLCLSPITHASAPNTWKISQINQTLSLYKKENNVDFILSLKKNILPLLQIKIPENFIHDDTSNTLVIKLNHTLFTLFRKQNSRNPLFELSLNNEQYKQFETEFTTQKTAFILTSRYIIPVSLQGTNNFTDFLKNYSLQNKNYYTLFFENTHITSTMLLWTIGIICFIILIFSRKKIQKIITMLFFVHKKKKAFTLALQEIKQNAKILAIKRKQLVYKDDYGTLIEDKWIKEIQRFIKVRIKPVLYHAHLLEIFPYIRISIIKEIKKAAKTNIRNKTRFSSSITPLEYESFCAELLCQIGWNAKVTVASGDQGADVIAIKNKRKLVLQCKLYKNPVGNKAVQEINAARQFYQADYAAVVSNSTYTISARQLANATDITLLHHENLQNFAQSLQ